MAGYHRSLVTACIGAVLTVAFAVTITLTHYDALFSHRTSDPYAMAFARAEAPVHYVSQLGDFTKLFIAEKEYLRFEGPSPAAADVAYRSSRQPGQTWRITSDTYRHIDPGRRLAI